jgi:amidase
LAELVKQKEISASELCNTAIQNIESYNPLLNAVVTFLYSQVSEQIEEPLVQGQFTGVPILLKDLLASYAGAPLTSGSRAFEFFVPDHDSEVVSRIKKTGSLILGKTNCPEFGLMGVTEPKLHGPARNPWNTDYTPGGSSGGSAAAVAVGMVPMASAGDGGGSIRIPAAYCGLFGLKPSRGRVPSGPDYGEIWQGAVSEHVITRTVRDSAAMLDAIQGPDIGAPYSIQDPERPYLEEVGLDPGKLTIAFCTESPINTPVDEECIKAVENTAKLLETLGHHLEEAKPDIDGLALAKSYTMLYCGEMAADLKAIPAIIGRKLNAVDLELETKTLAVLGRAAQQVSSLLRCESGARLPELWGHFTKNTIFTLHQQQVVCLPE